MNNHIKTLCIYCEKPVSIRTERCPVCHSSTFTVGARFRPPRVGDRAWKKIRPALIGWYLIHTEMIPTNYLVELIKNIGAPKKLRKRGWRGV